MMKHLTHGFGKHFLYYCRGSVAMVAKEGVFILHYFEFHQI